MSFSFATKEKIMQTVITCFWQKYPSVPHPREAGHGDCQNCSANFDNHFCTGFEPEVTILLVEIRDGIMEDVEIE